MMRRRANPVTAASCHTALMTSALSASAQTLMSVVRSSSWYKSVRLKISKNRRSDSAFLTTEVTDITDDRGSGNYQRYPRNLR